jgi:hypothetical protein
LVPITQLNKLSIDYKNSIYNKEAEIKLFINDEFRTTIHPSISHLDVVLGEGDIIYIPSFFMIDCIEKDKSKAFQMEFKPYSRIEENIFNLILNKNVIDLDF